MKIDDLPDLKINKYPERINLAVSSEMKRKLELLKEHGKDTPELIRKLIENAIKDIAV